MKLIIALIQPEKLPDVKAALFKADVSKMTVTNAIGAGQQKGYTEVYRGVVEEINLIRKVKVEIVVNDEFVESTVNAVIAGAKTGNIGDGKIFVLPVEDVVRIRTGEKGKDAVG